MSDTAIAVPAKRPPLGRLLLLTYMVLVFFFGGGEDSGFGWSLLAALFIGP
jgi:hypothetical protein